MTVLVVNLDIAFKYHIAVILNIFLMTNIEVNGHIIRQTEFGGFFQVIGDDDFAVFLKVIYRSHVVRGNDKIHMSENSANAPLTALLNL